MEDPKKTKGLVKREIVRMVTPGTLINSNLLSDKTNNFFAALTQVGKIIGLAFLDLTTGEFWVSEFTNERDLLNEIYRLHPAEFLTSEKFKGLHDSFLKKSGNPIRSWSTLKPTGILTIRQRIISDRAF